MMPSLQPSSHANIFSSVLGVISSSIGSAAGVYVLVSVTGYLSFGNDITGNIVSMCTYPLAWKFCPLFCD